eukprot:365554-Chlamydomonas_euryale.AAC.16
MSLLASSCDDDELADMSPGAVARAHTAARLVGAALPAGIIQHAVRSRRSRVKREGDDGIR